MTRSFRNVFCILNLLLSFHVAACSEYCMGHFNATCSLDEVVLITSAVYGRMKIGRCLTRDYFVGCQTDVREILEQRCAGRHRCSIKIPDTELHRIQPCPSDLMTYLDASYICMKVAFSDDSTCRRQQRLEAPAHDGYLSSAVTAERGYGTSTCPWIVRAEPGQLLNFTLIVFTYGERKVLGSGRCVASIVISDDKNDDVIEVSVCDDDRRRKHVHTTKTHRVSVEIRLPSVDQYALPQFLLHYTAVGCKDLDHVANAWVSRQFDTATVRCNDSGAIWHLVCSDGQWIGEYEHCNAAFLGKEQTNGWQSSQLQTALPFGLIIAVLIGVCLGFVVGILLLLVMLNCHRRKQNSGREGNETDFCDNEREPSYTETTFSTLKSPTIRSVATCQHHLGSIMIPDLSNRNR